MSIEKRLTDHMNEFAERVEITSGDGELIAQRASNGNQRAITTVTAALVLLLAGAGFLFLSNDNDGATSVAAGELESAEETTDDAGEAPVDLEIIDVTSSDAPIYGKTKVSDGVYYVLSTAPGVVDTSRELSNDEWNRLYRPNTFYVLDDDREWQVSKVDDRFVSDFAVQDGLLYVLSTGSMTSDTATFGTSSDQGASWSWETLDGLPVSDSVTLFLTGDQTLIYGSRWERTDYDWTIKTARENGIDLDERTLQWIDEEGISYLPVDPADDCLVFVAQFMPGLDELRLYAEEGGLDEEGFEEELGHMLSYAQEESAFLGCDLTFNSLDDLEAFDVPEPVVVSWDELGVEIPDDWKSWRGLFAVNGDGTLAEKELPFGTGDTGWAQLRGDTLEIAVFMPNEEVSSEDPFGYENGTEVLWSTTDGENWTSTEVNHNEEDAYYYEEFVTPAAGGYEYRMWYDEAKQQEQDRLIQEIDEAVMSGEMSEEEAYGDLNFVTPNILQRSRDGSTWETVDPATYTSGLDLGDRTLQDVRGSELGIVLIFSDMTWDDEPEPGAVVAVSNDGETWDSFDVVGSDNFVTSNDDSILILSHDWMIQPGETMGRSQALLVQPAG